MRAVVVKHEEHEGLGLLEKPLRDAGYQLVTRFRGVEHREDLEAELLVVLGGSMSVTQRDRHPFLDDELGVLSERLALGRPCLGICFGAQLLATAAGATVSLGKNGLEVGVAPVRLTKQGLEDPAFKELPPKAVMALWHEDTWSAVPEGVLLASTDRYTQQAFRVGKSYGLQFHPELTADAFGEWLTRDAELLELDGKNVEELRAGLPKLRAVEQQNVFFLERLVKQLGR